MAVNFWIWLELLTEARREGQVPQSVLNSYERAFQDEIEKLMARTHDPAQREAFRRMLDCPVIDRRGQCRRFADYMLGALIRNRIHERADMQEALAYVVEKMMMPVGSKGEPRVTLFSDFDPNRPDAPAYLQARFLTWLKFAVDNIRRGKIPRLSTTDPRMSGSVAMLPGRRRKGEPSMGVSPDEIATRPDRDAELREMIADIEALLRRKETAEDFPLVALFRAIMSGANSDAQRRQFGDHETREARKMIVDTIRDYAEKSGNHRLLYLLGQFAGFRSNEPMPKRAVPMPAKTPRLPPGPDKDYASIISVIDRHGGGPVGTSILGTARSRWLTYPPRDPASGHANRLSEVLANAMRDGVLVAHKTQKGALIYSLGPGAAKYRQDVGGAAAIVVQ